MTSAKRIPKISDVERVAVVDKSSSRKNGDSNAFGALFLITLGVLFLLNNFGILPWGIWATLWRFWPVFLILAGLQIIAGKSKFANIFVTLIGIGLIIIIILYSITNSQNSPGFLPDFPRWDRQQNRFNLRSDPEYNREEILEIKSTDYTEVTKRNVELNLGAGSFFLDTTDTNSFVYIKTHTNSSGTPLTHKKEGSELIINFKSTENIKGFFDVGGDTSVQIGKPELSTTIKTELGAGKLDADITNLKLDTFELQVGAGNAEILFSEISIPKDTRIEIGAGAATLNIPENTGLKVVYEIGLGKLQINDTSLFGKGSYTSPDFDSKASRMILSVRVGAGSVTIRK